MREFLGHLGNGISAQEAAELQYLSSPDLGEASLQRVGCRGAQHPRESSTPWSAPGASPSAGGAQPLPPPQE